MRILRLARWSLSRLMKLATRRPPMIATKAALAVMMVDRKGAGSIVTWVPEAPECAVAR